MAWFVTSLRENPELAIFLTLAIGFSIGRLRIGTFRLGNVVGTLLAGVLVGQLGIELDSVVRVVFFNLFLFATGYKVGAGSKLPVLGYTVPYALGNILLTAWGPVIVILTR